MTKEELKRKVCEAIDRRAGELTEVGETIMRMPELGYKELRTAAVVEEKFKSLGLPYRKEVALTGLIANLKGEREGVKVAVLGELDAVLCPGHPQADPETGAAHSCGHNAQITSMLGVAMGLIDAGAMEHLGGEVALMAVPAEEPVEIEFRQKLRKEGKIQFLGGKQEFIALGEFDDVDAAVMMHLSTPGNSNKKATVGESSNGFLAKFIKFKGKEAHAGGAPHLGVNALNGAMLGLMAIHAQRETFKDGDHIRIHPIVTHGGDLVNVVPADVRMETYVRGAEMDAIVDASAKVNRALQAGADAVGAQVVIEEIPGFLPRFDNPDLCNVFRANISALVGPENVEDGTHGAGSTDMADVEAVVPAIHPYIAAAVGRGHSEDYRIADPELAYIISGKALAMTVIDLMWDGGKLAKEIKASFTPKYTKESYLQMWHDLTEGEEGAKHD